MWVPTIFLMLIHLVAAGLLCWGVDEINNDYTIYTFCGYLIMLAAFSIKNHFELLSGILYDRDATLKSIDERNNKE